MDRLVRLFLRLGLIFEPKPAPVPVRIAARDRRRPH